MSAEKQTGVVHLGGKAVRGCRRRLGGGIWGRVGRRGRASDGDMVVDWFTQNLGSEALVGMIRLRWECIWLAHDWLRGGFGAQGGRGIEGAGDQGGGHDWEGGAL